MKIIDRYLVRRFVTWLFLWTCVIGGLYVVADLTTNQDYLSVKGDRPAWSVLSEYYLYRGAAGIDMLLPMLVLISTMMVISSMIRKNELIALQAMGVPFRRLMTPILIVGLVLCGFAFWTREFYVPAHAVQIIQTPQGLAENRTEYPVFKMADSLTHIKIDGQTILPNQGIINEPVISLPALLSRYGSELTAESAQWHPKDDTLPNGYLLHNVRRPKEILSSPSLDLLGKARSSTPIDPQAPSTPDGEDRQEKPTDSAQTIILYSPSDTPSLEPTDCFIVTGLPPMILAAGDNWKFNASTAQLIAAVGNPSITANAAQDITSKAARDLKFRVHQRILRPVFDILPLLLGLPILFLSANKKPLARIANGLLVAGLFMGTTFAGAYFGSRSGSPILGAWIPLFLFVPVAVNLMSDLRRS
ncbi:MAG: LptF/LptG family permease [Thermoguttaceae bacterium]|nr:LptF/LptG family permease [Thermoguttaceae bacterium]